MLKELNMPLNQKYQKRKIQSNKIIKNNSSTNKNIIKIGLESSLSPSYNSTLGDTPNYSKIDKKSINSNHSKRRIKSIIFNKGKRDYNNVINNNGNKKTNYLKKKYMNQFLRCISQDNLNTKINENIIKKAKDDYDNNLKNLSSLIDEINNKGFKRNASLIIEKKNKINTLTEKLSHLNFEINQ